MGQCPVAPVKGGPIKNQGLYPPGVRPETLGEGLAPGREGGTALGKLEDRHA